MFSKLFNALEKTRFSLLGAFKNIKQGKISLDDLEKIGKVEGSSLTLIEKR